MFLDFITLCLFMLRVSEQVWIRKWVMEALFVSKEGKDWLYILQKT
jgi:hypothetical protein